MEAVKENFYATIDGLDTPVSRIFYGTAAPPYNTGGDGNAMLDRVMELGVNAFDCARVYGKAEASLGRWLATRDDREKIVILSKCGHPDPLGRRRVNAKAMQRDLTRSLAELGTTYIDIYLLHRDDPASPVSEVVETFNEMKAAGKIRLFGGSNWTHQRIEAANEYAYAHGLQPFSVSSPNFGLAEQIDDLWGGGCVTISGKDGAAGREYYRKTQIPVIAYSSLGRGLFSGRLSPDATKKQAAEVLDSYAMKGYYCAENLERVRRCGELAAQKGVTVPQIAMAWIFRRGLNMFAVVSTSSAERLQQNIEACGIELTEDECRYLNLEV